MQVTKEEFETMVDELLNQEPISYNMLCTVAEREVRPEVRKWCLGTKSLRNKGCEDDIMQETQIRLIVGVIPDFLLKDDADAPYNHDLLEFLKWMYLEAQKAKWAAMKRISQQAKKTCSLEEMTLADVLDMQAALEAQEDVKERISRLKQAFDTALSVDAGIYKVLTWFAQFMFILDQNVTKIQSNNLILEAFAEKTLNEMYAMLLGASNRIPWITVTQQQHARILAALQKPWNQELTYGESKYKDFFMKQSGEASGKKSISDWTHRMNQAICKRMASQDDPPRKKSGKNSSPQAGERKRGGEDEASNC